jgi:hypothetical protein
VFKNFFKDKDGNVIIGQRPNLPIVVWAIASVSTRLVSEPTLEEVLSMLSFGAIFTWAWLELFHGDCSFRRVLGASVLVVILLFPLF